jgi:Cu(I)/Ag(I) efflux system protein CusF
MKNRLPFLAAAALSLAALCGTCAAAEAGKQPVAAAAAAMTTGEVRKIDAALARVTIKHERIANLDMDAMTMVFRATQPEQLKGLKAGDKVRFHAESDKGALVVTHIEAAK